MLDMGGVACHRAEKTPTSAGGHGHLGGHPPRSFYVTCVCVVGPLHVWVGALGSLAAWVPFRLGMRRIPGGMTMNIEILKVCIFYLSTK